MTPLISRNPATGEVLRELTPTDPADLSLVFARAREAQSRWAAVPPKRRAARLVQLRETILNRADELIAIISAENGKPPTEALASELIPSIETISYFVKRGPKLLRDREIPLRLMRHRKSILSRGPIGVVAIIAPWNYPFLLPLADIVMALMAGNAVIFKPSETTPLIGLKIQELCDEAGIPPNTLQTILGDGGLGAALVAAKPDKVFFTGSAATGKHIMASAAKNLTPVNLELGGKNALIVLPDADLDFATSAALWGGFSNSGQVCGATSRAIVHESIASTFAQKLAEKASFLRQGTGLALNHDLGSITLEKQKAVYESHLESARRGGATLLAGGEFNASRSALKPTLIAAHLGPREPSLSAEAGDPCIESLPVYREESFGPIVTIVTYKSLSEAVVKANDTPYGLAASIITRNLRQAEDVARQLQVGTVMINEVIYTAGLPETPWGGIKESGMGRTHSDLGFYEFTHLRHIHLPRSRMLIFKSLWWFPYTPFQYLAFRNLLDLYRIHWTDKLKAFPHFLLNLIRFVKTEKRL